MKPPKKVKSPIDGGYITKGKEYDVIRLESKLESPKYGYYFVIINDEGFESKCLEKECSHINDLNWIVTEREN